MEEWKDIEGNDDYQVSSFGRVRSLDRLIIYANGKRIHRKGVVLAFGKHTGGYVQVSLGASCQNNYVHRLVCTAFIDNPENKGDVNHKNGIKDDNRVENLEWMTRSENIIHGYKTGLIDPMAKGKKGDKNSNAKLTESEVLFIRAASESKKSLSKMYDVSVSTIGRVLDRISWAHI